MRFLKKNFFFLIILLIYLKLGFDFLPLYQYQLNSDGAQYLSIGMKYARGEFAQAINGYWSPLISWLVVPFLWAGLKPVYAVKTLSLFIGLLTLISFRILSLRFPIEDKIRITFTLGLIPTIVWYTYGLTTPDLLVAVLVFFYLSVILHENYPKSLLYAVLCGALGALGYFSKQFFGFYFLVHFLVFNVIYFLQVKRIDRFKVERNYIVGMIIFLILISPWIYLLSNKYGFFTIGTSSTFNRSIVGLFSGGVPMFSKGLLQPPNNTALSSWEDPSYYIINYPGQYRNWSPFESKLLLNHQWGLIKFNFFKILSDFKFFHPLLSWVVIACLILSIRFPIKSILKNKAFFLLVSTVIYVFGYMTTSVVFRYIYPAFFLLTIALGYIISLIFKNKSFNWIHKIIILIFLFLSLSYYDWLRLNESKNLGINEYILAQDLKNKYHLLPGKKYATIKNYETSEIVTFFLEGQFYGQLISTSNETAFKDLKKYQIDYFFAWGDIFNDKLTFEQTWFNKYKEITGGKMGELKIYSLKERRF